jgi:hypothetical protein
MDTDDSIDEDGLHFLTAMMMMSIILLHCWRYNVVILESMLSRNTELFQASKYPIAISFGSQRYQL